MRLILYLGADFFCPLQGGGRAGPLPVCSITEENYYPGVRARKPFIWGKEIEDTQIRFSLYNWKQTLIITN